MSATNVLLPVPLFPINTHVAGPEPVLRLSSILFGLNFDKLIDMYIYKNYFKCDVKIIRPFNTYGPRQSSRAIIPNVISQIVAKEKKITVGDISPTRDFSYVEDTCRAFVKIAEHDNTIGKVINTGSNSEISIVDLIQLIQSIMGSDLEVFQSKERIRPLNSEVHRLFCDSSLLIELTSFKYTVDNLLI